MVSPPRTPTRTLASASAGHSSSPASCDASAPSGARGAGAAADDEAGRDDDLAAFLTVALEPLEGEPDGDLSLLEVALRDAGEVDARVPREGAVVESGQRHLDG